MSDTVEKGFKIHEGRLAWFQSKMAKLAKRAARIGVPAPTYVLGAAELVEETHREEAGEDPLTGRPVYTEYPVYTRYYPVEISGEAPKYAGWVFAATLQTLAGGEVLVRGFGETPLPVRFRAQETSTDCEHCNVSRRRNETFVLLHDTGAYKQVGRQCLKDFLGHADPERLAAQAEFLSEAMGLGEGCGSGSGGETVLALDYFLGFVAAAMNAFGWCSRTKAREQQRQATADAAMEHAAPSKSLLRDPKWKRLAVTDADKVRAEVALDWAEDLTDAEVEGSDYLHNIRAIARAKLVEHRTAGYAASIIIACEKAQDRVREAKARPTSNYVGIIGERQLFTVKLERVLEITTDYGVSYLHFFTDADGNEIKWFGSNRLYRWPGMHQADKVQEGDCVVVKATVKKHEEYKGRKQTVVNRAEVYVERPKATKANKKIAQALVDFMASFGESVEA